MRTYQGRVAELKLHQGEMSAIIACPNEVVPTAGQYLLAAQDSAILASPLFLTGYDRQGFLAAPPFPDSWRPGTELSLYGPLGQGFHLPADISRLGLIALGGTKARLMPLVNPSRSTYFSVTLFSDAPIINLPPDLEAYPLRDLAEALSWADFFAVDVDLEHLSGLAEHFENIPKGIAGLRGQVLIHASMPCGSLADCGVCAVKVKNSWKLACKDGPVFDLQDLLEGIRG